jgi:hypothetical protein
MIDRALTVINGEGYELPRVFFWGREHRPVSDMADERICAYFYDTRVDKAYWLPGLPFLMETFAMTDEGITSKYVIGATGQVEAHEGPRETRGLDKWGYGRFVDTLMTFGESVEPPESRDVRRIIFELIDLFWMNPTVAEARAWGAYLYESDPTGTSALRLAGPRGGPWSAGAHVLSCHPGAQGAISN